MVPFNVLDFARAKSEALVYILVIYSKRIKIV